MAFGPAVAVRTMSEAEIEEPVADAPAERPDPGDGGVSGTLPWSWQILTRASFLAPSGERTLLERKRWIAGRKVVAISVHHSASARPINRAASPQIVARRC